MQESSAKWDRNMAELEFAGTKVTYFWNEDRFHHRVSIQTSDGWLDLLESVEGTSADPWPVSPPWQQIVRESFGHLGEDVLLGVGLSGNGHWSIAVHPTNSEPSQDHPAQFRGLAFDIACKTSTPATSLGSRWIVAPLWSIQQTSDRHIVLVTRSPGLETKAFLNILHGSAKIHSEPSRVLLEVYPDTDLNHPQTHRWAVRIETEQTEQTEQRE